MNRLLQRGFGLVEILIALTLGIVIILGVTTLYTDSSRSLSDVARQTSLTETASYAMDLLSSDIELAGFWGETGVTPSLANIKIGGTLGMEAIDPNPQEGDGFYQETVPCACIGTGIQAICEYNTNATDGSPATKELEYLLEPPEELVRGMFFPLYASSSPQLNNETGATTNRCGAFDQARPTSEFVAIRRASTCSATTDATEGCRPLDTMYHLQVCGDQETNNDCEKDGQITLTNVPARMNATFRDESVAPVYRYISRIYYVDSDYVLSRIFLDDVAGSANPTYLKEELVDGVELLRFEWQIDTSGDGFTDISTNSPTWQEWKQVVGVTIWMVVRAASPEKNFTDERVYSVAGASFLVPDGFEEYRRAVFSRAVELPNLAGRRR